MANAFNDDVRNGIRGEGYRIDGDKPACKNYDRWDTYT